MARPHNQHVLAMAAYISHDQRGPCDRRYTAPAARDNMLHG
jgi:hypothetical protein